MSPCSQQPTTLPASRGRQSRDLRRVRLGPSRTEASTRAPSGVHHSVIGPPCTMTPLCRKVGPGSLSKGNLSSAGKHDVYLIK